MRTGFFFSFFFSSLAFCGALDPLQDISSASEPLKEAAKAVVRIQTADGVGTGFFITPTGALVTNQHVLGPENCLRKGCYVTLDYDYQKEGKWKRSHDVFVEPLFTIPILDASVYRVRNLGKKARPGKTVRGNAYLKFSDVETLSRGAKIYAVGHPKGALKKWNEGEIYGVRKDWYHSTLMLLGGSSGSPIVNDKGELVGIVHRGLEDAEKALSFTQVQGTTFFSNAAPLKTMLETVLAEKGENESLESFSEGDDYLSVQHLLATRQRSLEVEQDGKARKMSALQLIQTACEATVDDENAENDPDEAYDACSIVFDLVNCNDPKDTPRFKSCPSKKEQQSWLKLFERLAALEEKKNQNPIHWAILAPTIFAKSDHEARRLGRELMTRYFESHEPFSEIEVIDAAAITSLRKEDMQWKGKDLYAELLQFEKLPYYDRQVEELQSAVEALVKIKIMPLDEAKRLGQKVMLSERVPAGIKLDFESMLFEIAAKLVTPN